MKVEFRACFAKDLRNIKDKVLLTRLKVAIEEIERAIIFQDFYALKRSHGGADCLLPAPRWRLSLGLLIEGDKVVFVRCLNRREIHRYFPKPHVTLLSQRTRPKPRPDITPFRFVEIPVCILNQPRPRGPATTA